MAEPTRPPVSVVNVETVCTALLDPPTITGPTASRLSSPPFSLFPALSRNNNVNVQCGATVSLSTPTDSVPTLSGPTNSPPHVGLPVSLSQALLMQCNNRNTIDIPTVSLPHSTPDQSQTSFRGRRVTVPRAGAGAFARVYCEDPFVECTESYVDSYESSIATTMATPPRIVLLSP
jgi:hypothetical protein